MQLALDKAPGDRAGGEPAFAFDRASSRRIDTDGHMHVASSIISAAAVNEYLGSEIPDFESLGLEPNKKYKLFRDPAELEKGAASFDGKPLLIVHTPLTAADHNREIVVGCVKAPTWDGETLRADLDIWDAEAIAGIESGDQADLSSGYRYVPVMESGTYEGMRYDGRMTEIIGNHIALVAIGRVKGAVVGDSALTQTKEIVMAKSLLTRKAAFAQGATLVALKPKLAQDAKVDLSKVFVGITAKNFKAKIPAMIAGITKATEGKLAQDADLSDFVDLLDAVAEADVVEVVESASNAGLPMKPDDDDTANDADDTKVRALLKAKGLSDDEIEEICAAFAGGAAMDDDMDAGAMDEPPPFKGKPEVGGGKKKDDKDMVTKPAMDAAIKSSVEAATKAAIKVQTAIREAERAVRPYVGDLAIAHDSADGVYRTALETLGVECEGVHASALPTILKMQPLPGTKKAVEPRLAQDAAAKTSFATRFPETARIGTV